MTNIQSFQRYIGLSTDTKPTGVNAGSEFIEKDTQEKYIFDNSSWERTADNYPYEISIGEGLRTNHRTWYKLGFSASITTTPEDIWEVGGLYTFATSAGKLEVISDNAADSSVGAGARTVEIHYLTSSFDEKSEIVTLTGASAVETASSDFYRVNYFKVLTTGSTPNAVGNIDIRATADTPIYSRIAAGTTRSRDSVFTVPKDNSLYISQIDYGAEHTAANKFSLITLRGKYDFIDSVTSNLFYPEATALLDNGTVPIHYDVPLKFPAGTDMKMTASSNGTAAINVALRGWLES
jgi:hypothetical protein